MLVVALRLLVRLLLPAAGGRRRLTDGYARQVAAQLVMVRRVVVVVLAAWQLTLKVKAQQLLTSPRVGGADWQIYAADAVKVTAVGNAGPFNAAAVATATG